MVASADLRGRQPRQSRVDNQANQLAARDLKGHLLPDRNHGFGNEAYMVRRRWDYFVRYLLGAEPPAGYELKPPAGAGRGGAAPRQ